MASVFRSAPRAYLALLVLLAALLALAPDASAKKLPSYKVKLTFTQSRPWTYHYVQTSTDCTRTDDGNGLDEVTTTGTARFGLTRRGGVAGFGLVATHARTGARSHTVSGAECAPSAVFPSTWSIITQTAGTVTAAEPTAECGPQKTKVSFPKLELAGSHLVLEWPSDPTPDFGTCPYFDGANEASSGNQLPPSAYRDVVMKVSRKQLRAGKRRVTATGTATKSAIETCATLVQPCAEGVTYNATASVEARVKAVFTRTRR